MKHVLVIFFHVNVDDILFVKIFYFI